MDVFIRILRFLSYEQRLARVREFEPTGVAKYKDRAYPREILESAEPAKDHGKSRFVNGV
jgi:hypothetical protein